MRRHDFASIPASVALAIVACAVLAVAGSCSKREERQTSRLFNTPEDAVRALNDAVAKGNVDHVLEIFGPDGKELVDSSDPLTARRNREVYAVAVKEGWRLVDDGRRKELIVGKEAWPFPVPLVKDAGGWRFDAAAGREEVLTRRIGRNELKAIQACRMYVAAQRHYARDGHDGRPAGRYARTFSSDPGKHNGLYWPAARGERRSPLGDLVSNAALEQATQRANAKPAPFHGYYFRILTGQGAAASGGVTDYIVHGELSGGFALVVWPAQYERTGIMSFIVNQDGIVHEKDLGPTTDATARKMTLYDPDDSWAVAQ
jgi:hypothetical protein